LHQIEHRGLLALRCLAKRRKFKIGAIVENPPKVKVTAGATAKWVGSRGMLGDSWCQPQSCVIGVKSQMPNAKQAKPIIISQRRSM